MLKNPHFDEVVTHVLFYSKPYRSVKKIWLFGSQARKDATAVSDYDFAFEWEEMLNESWGELAGVLREKSPVLNQLDLVRLDEASSELRTKIKKEGVLLYGKD